MNMADDNDEVVQRYGGRTYARRRRRGDNEVEGPVVNTIDPIVDEGSDRSNEVIEPDTTVLLRDWQNHVGYGLIIGMDRGFLGFKKATISLTKWSIDAECSEFRNRVRSSPLYVLANACYNVENRVLISGFVERWHPETSTFHLPFGEMTITLDDVRHITGLPVSGKPVNVEFKKEDVFVFTEMVTRLLGVVTEETMVSRKWLKDTFAYKCKNATRKGRKGKEVAHDDDAPSVDQAVRAYLLYLLSATIFQDRQGDKIRLVYVYFLEDLDMVGDWAWGAAALAHLYRKLSKATQMSTAGVSGYLTLFEAWIYEHFPSLRPRVNSEFDESMVRSLKWRLVVGVNDERALKDLIILRKDLDMLGKKDVIWNAYLDRRLMVPDDDVTWFYGCIRSMDDVKAYHPNRVVRQFGHVQGVPIGPIQPKKAQRPGKPKQYVVTHASRDDDFSGFLNHLVHASQRGVVATVDWQCTNDYMPWWRSVAVRRLTDARPNMNDQVVLDRKSRKMVVDALHDIHQNPQQKHSKNDFMKVINMAYELLTCGSCSATNQDVQEPEHVQEETVVAEEVRTKRSRKASRK